MKKFKSILLATLCVAMVVALSVGGTIAYLTSTDEDINVMTMGNVKIEQIEQEWNANGELVDFTQLKPLYPYVGTLGWTNKDYENGAYRKFTMENVVDKYVSVKNTGKSDAYVRTIIALEMGEFTAKEFEQIGISINKINGSEFKFPGTWEWSGYFVASINGKNYYIMVATHEAELAANETTIPSLLQVYLASSANNQDVEKLDGNKNNKYDILVKSQAVQTKGFTDANTALNTAFGVVNDTNVANWFKGMAYEKIVTNVTELKQAITEDVEMILGNDIAGNATEGVYVHNYANAIIYGDENSLTLGNEKNYGFFSNIGSTTVFNDVDFVFAGGGIVARDGAKVTFNSGTAKIATSAQGHRHMFYLYGEGTVITVNGGNFSFEEYMKRTYGYVADNAKLIINGGTFGKAPNHPSEDNLPFMTEDGGQVIINGGTFGFNPTTWVADGHTVVNNGNGTWTVQ